jgi:hypothetical protein
MACSQFIYRRGAVTIERVLEQWTMYEIGFKVENEYGSSRVFVAALQDADCSWRNETVLNRVIECWNMVEASVTEWLADETVMIGMEFDPVSQILYPRNSW